ncbi:hypothetical protein B9Z55_001347 [Caenorhabditis nigoni]|uniref:Uncharacterized protein n=1 Tax=Caenorhabditis nigoni TaxID=1611254 RepID=A0A2G5VFF1_9PELO|nr:hypothetical protein B9Z55_001347 [Caenorhabditis nigoni]
MWNSLLTIRLIRIKESQSSTNEEADNRIHKPMRSKDMESLLAIPRISLPYYRISQALLGLQPNSSLFRCELLYNLCFGAYASSSYHFADQKTE